MKNKNKGSVTIEAAISLLVMITVVVTFGSFIKVVHIHSVMQHALIQTANEMAEYSYLYSLTGINRVNNAVTDQTQGGSETVSAAIDEATRIYDDITSGKIVTSIDTDKFNLKELAVGLVKAIAGEVYEGGKSALINTAVTKPLLKSYLPEDADNYLKQNNVVGGFDGIDFSKSRYFSSNDNEIEIVAVYSVKFFAPIPIIDKVTIVQSAKTRAYMSE